MTFANVLIWQKLQKQLYLSISFSTGHTNSPPADVFKEIEMFLHGILSSHMLFNSSLWSIKLSFLLFFKTLGNKIRRQRLIWWSVLAFTVVSYGPCIGLIDFKCLVGLTGIDLCNSLKLPCGCKAITNMSSKMFESSHSLSWISFFTTWYLLWHHNRCSQWVQ